MLACTSTQQLLRHTQHNRNMTPPNGRTIMKSTICSLALAIFTWFAPSARAAWDTNAWPSWQHPRGDAIQTRMWQTYSASVERAMAISTNYALPPHPVTWRTNQSYALLNGYSTNSLYRHEREWLAAWKSWVTNAVTNYVNRTGRETDETVHGWPEITALDQLYICEWLDIPTNYWTQTPWRQLDGAGNAQTSSWTQAGYSNLDYGWKPVTQILAMLTWTLKPDPVRRATTNTFGQVSSRAANEYVGRGRAPPPAAWDSATEEADANLVIEWSFATEPSWLAYGIVYQNVCGSEIIANGYADTTKRAIAAEFIEPCYTGSVCAVDLVSLPAVYPVTISSVCDGIGTITVTTNTPPLFDGVGFNLIRDTPSVVGTVVKPIGWAATTNVWDTRVSGAWPDEPSESSVVVCHDTDENGDCHGRYDGRWFAAWRGFVSTREWLVYRWAFIY